MILRVVYYKIFDLNVAESLAYSNKESLYRLEGNGH